MDFLVRIEVMLEQLLQIITELATMISAVSLLGFLARLLLRLLEDANIRSV
jgi:hypothetical protein